jgi:hypothetical protein
MMKKVLLLFLILQLFVSLLANSEKVMANTKLNKLTELSEKYRKNWEYNNRKAVDYALENNLPIKKLSTVDHPGFELQRILIDNTLLYYYTTNADAAKTISTNKVHPGGTSGLSLTGNGFLLREWDEGKVRNTHQEFDTRVSIGDGSTTLSSHSTHVAGTMVSSGNFQINSRGMAYQASLKDFDWNNDISEMAAEAAAGALLSNHSYGPGLGWNWTGSSWSWRPGTGTEDPIFGFYYDSSLGAEGPKEWDEIAYNAPYYMIVTSAGNDDGDGPSTTPPNDGPYDCLGGGAVAKNVLTVAAVEDIVSGYTQPSDVVKASFSSTGPMDDGRIKPDISANGVNLYSTLDSSDSAYDGTYSGTSMASPSVTGSLMLVQEHYEDINGNGNFMKSSTIKALTVHCADEAGSYDGPDYKFGWGLMNTKRMTDYISDNGNSVQIHELTLSNGSNYTTSVTANGIEPLKVTICWTDPAGTPVALSVDPSDPMLVNDLDLRITRNASTYYPWKLDRLNPANAAINSSENNVDNIEQVYVASPETASYTIIVDHDGTLVDDTGSTSIQDFAIIISGITTGDPVCAITSPVNNAEIQKGTVQTITVQASDPAKSVSSVDFYIDNIWKANDNSAPFTWNWDTSSYSIGSHTIKAIATDNVSNTGEHSIDITLWEPESIPFTEDYSSPASWTQQGVNCGSLWSVSATNQSGGASPEMHCTWEQTNPATTRYISPPLNTIGYSSLDLSFKHLYDAYGTGVTMKIQSSSDKINWTDEAWSIAGGTSNISGTVNTTISDNLGNITYIAWVLDGNLYQYDNWYFDDVSVTGIFSGPYANFSASPLSTYIGENVTFTDASGGGTISSWSWNFGAGASPATANMQGPHVVTYSTIGTKTVSLTVNGTETETKTDYITITSAPVFSISPSSLDFGNIEIGNNSTMQFTITNAGGGTLTGNITTPTGYVVAEAAKSSIEFIKFDKDNKKDLRNTLSYSIVAGSPQTYDIIFEPTTADNYNGTITITCNEDTPSDISVTGSGIAAEISLSTVNVNQTIPQNETATNNVIISNIGDATLNFNAAIQYAKGRASLNAYPQSSTYWTGTCNSTSKTATSLVETYRQNNTRRRGWMKFDISAIPNDATINSVTFNAYVNSVDILSWNTTKLTTEPVSGSAGNIYTEINGSINTYSTSSSATTGWLQQLLSGNIITDFQNTLSQGWFAIGFDSDTNRNGIIFDGWNESNPPYLTIDYSPTATWLSITPLSDSINGGEVGFLQLTFDSTGLAKGTYNATINITSNDQNSPHAIAVALTVDNTLTQTASAGSNNGGSGAASVDVPPVFIDSATIDPDVSITPTGAVPVAVDITVSDAPLNPVANPENVLISYRMDITGNISGNNLSGALNYGALSPSSIVYYDGSWKTPSNVSFGGGQVTFNFTLGSKGTEVEFLLGAENPLPVTLSAFAAHHDLGTTYLTWTTQSELNNSHWNVYRSLSENLGQAQKINPEGIEGSGTTSEATDYKYYDELEQQAELTYWYWIECVDYSGNTELFAPVTITIPQQEDTPPEIPTSYGLYANYPNPFNPSTQIGFALQEPANAYLSVYDVKGRLVRHLLTGEMTPAEQVIRITWDGKDEFGKHVGSGVYFYRLKAGHKDYVRKMLLIK